MQVKGIFILTTLLYVQNLISGASLGNNDLFNGTADGVKMEPSDDFERIYKNYYLDESTNYKMGDIETYFSDLRSGQTKKNHPFHSPKILPVSNQFDTTPRLWSNTNQESAPVIFAHSSGSQQSYDDSKPEVIGNNHVDYGRTAQHLSHQAEHDYYPNSHYNQNVIQSQQISENIEQTGSDQSNPFFSNGDSVYIDEYSKSNTYPEYARNSEYTNNQDSYKDATHGLNQVFHYDEANKGHKDELLHFSEVDRNNNLNEPFFSIEEGKELHSNVAGMKDHLEERPNFDQKSVGDSHSDVHADLDGLSHTQDHSNKQSHSDEDAEDHLHELSHSDEDAEDHLHELSHSDEEVSENNLHELSHSTEEVLDELSFSDEKDHLDEPLHSDKADAKDHSEEGAEDNMDELSHSDEESTNSFGNEGLKPTAIIENVHITSGNDLVGFEGSGDLEDSNNPLVDARLGNSKSGRIINVFQRSNGTDPPECTTPKGEKGHCRSLTQCPISESLSGYNVFLQYLCLSSGIFVGVCCPDNPVVEVSDSEENFTDDKEGLKQPQEGCGRSTNSRIVGGTISAPHEWTWMVALMRRNRFFCGGVILNDRYVLTAAHCVLGIQVRHLTVRLGEYNFNEKNEHQQDIPVAEIKRHALFVTLTFQHDIALLKLRNRIDFTKVVGSICLPSSESRHFADTNATVVGWGTVSFGGQASSVLRQVTVPVWDNDDCDKTYRFERINESFLCAGSPENGEDACQGDSGGPLMVLNDEGRWEVIGIVSWGRRCGDPTYPGVYTRVTTYLDWIKENMQ